MHSVKKLKCVKLVKVIVSKHFEYKSILINCHAFTFTVFCDSHIYTKQIIYAFEQYYYEKGSPKIINRLLYIRIWMFFKFNITREATGTR